MNKLYAKILSIIISLALINFSFAEAVNDKGMNDYVNHWAQRDIDTFKHLEYVNGDAEGKFMPDRPITRSEFVAMLNRMFDFHSMSNEVSHYKDVPNDAWFYNDVAIALSAGYIEGISNTEMAPNEAVTREQAFTMINRIVTKYTSIENDVYREDALLTTFADADKISDYALDSFKFMVDKKFVIGDQDNQLNPTYKITRAEAVTVLNRIYRSEYYAAAETVIENNLTPLGEVSLEAITEPTVEEKTTTETTVVSIPFSSKKSNKNKHSKDSSEENSTSASTTEEPTTEAPTTEAPTTEAPTTEAPTTEAPTTEVPTTEAPTTEEPTAEAPTAEEPTTEESTTEAPTTEVPTTEAPTTEESTTEAPADEYLATTKINQTMYVATINMGENIDRAVIKYFEKYPHLKDKDIYFGKIFADSSKMLIYSQEAIEYSGLANISSLNIVDGLYVNENNILKPIKTTDDAIYDVSLVVGTVHRDKVYPIGKIFTGYPENEVDFGITLGNETKLVSDVNFNMKTTSSDAVVHNAIIAQRGNIKDDKPSDLRIINNDMTTGGNYKVIERGISVNFPVVKGKLEISNNTIVGGGLTTLNGVSNRGIAIELNSRALPNTEVVVFENTIKEWPYSGIGIMGGEDSTIKVQDNHLQNIGQNGIGIFVFGNLNDLHIKGNIVDGYGVRKIKKSSWGHDDGSFSNKYEVGIDLAYIDSVYGVKVNDKYYNDKELLRNHLQLVDNKVLNKTDNDAIEGVEGSTPVTIGHKYKFNDPKEAINSGKYIRPNTNMIIVKNEDEDVVFGLNQDYPDKQVTINNLKIIGNGSGRVSLSNNLIITGDLEINLPNASLKNEATVKGETRIIAIRDNDASSFSAVLNAADFYSTNWTNQTVSIEISNIINQTGNIIAPVDSKLTNNLKVYVAAEEITNKVSVDDLTDTVTFGAEYLKTIKHSTKFRLVYSDADNEVKEVSKNVTLDVLNLSSAKATYVDGKTPTIIQAYAPQEGIKIAIKDIKDAQGESVSATQSNLTDSIKVEYRLGYFADATEVEINDQSDIITLNKALLDKLPLPWGSAPHKINIHYNDTQNGVQSVEIDLDVYIVNKSGGEVEVLDVMTFTHGKAPVDGISFKIFNIKNAKGEIIPASETSLNDYVKIIPFPTNWKYEIDGTGDNIHFNHKYYTIDDDRDILTFNAEYLNRLNPNDQTLVEHGVKQFELTLKDPKHGINFKTNKMFIHIKSKQVALDTNTDISSDVYQIKADTIRSNHQVIDYNTKVIDLLGNIIPADPRQVLRVYQSKYLTDGKVADKNIYAYKNDYENLTTGDFLLVSAEDGKTTKVYQITLDGTQNQLFIDKIEEGISYKYGAYFIDIAKSDLTAKDLMAAVVAVDGAKKSVEFAGDSVDDNTKIRNGMHLILRFDGERQEYSLNTLSGKNYRSLIVANYDYPGEGSDLVGPKNDTVLMKRTFLAQDFDGQKIANPVIVKNATKAQFIEGITQAFADADDNDVSYIYYSGHGFNDKTSSMSYICTVDEALGQDSQLDNWLSVNDLKAALDQIKGTKVIILDSCNSGGFIGKVAVDAVTSPTTNDGDPFAAAFVADAVNSFASENASNSPTYLVGNDYKVLAASSQNEYSFEDKLNAVGKFTLALSEGAGVEGDLLADKNGDGVVTLEEIHAYTDRNVVYTSHVQTYPRNDVFPVFANPEVVKLNDDLTVSAKDNAYAIFIDAGRGMIKADNTPITPDMTVDEFLANILPSHKEQEVYVLPSMVDPKASNAKTGEQKLAPLDRLLVIAENGEQAAYPITVKAVELSDDVSIKSVGEGWYAKLQIIEHMKSISGTYQNKLTSGTTVEALLSFIVKGHDKQILFVVSGDAEEVLVNKKAETDTLAPNDKLVVMAENGKTIAYKLIVLKTANDALDMNSAFKIQGQGYNISIVSADKKLTDAMTVAELFAEIHNMDEIKMMYVRDKDWTRKAPSDKLTEGDVLSVMMKGQQMPFSYNLKIEKGENKVTPTVTTPSAIIITPPSDENHGEDTGNSLPSIIITP